MNEISKNKKKRNIRKIVLTVLLAAAVIAGVLFYIRPWNKETEQKEKTTKTTQVYEGVYTTSIDVSGYVAAYQTQTVQIRATGAVTAVYVKEGDKVSKGQVLATVDDSDQQYTVANLEQKLKTAQLSGTSTAREIELLEMQLESANKKVDNTKAYANFDGVVISVEISEGDYYEAGSTVMTIIDNSKLKATVEVDEIDIQMVETGMALSITSDSSPGVEIEGRVSYIPMVGRYSSQGIGVMDVEIVIDNPPQTLKPGFSFEGTIDIESEQSMLLVAQAAITTSRGVSRATKLNDDGTTETVIVQVKYLGENLYQVLSGLNAGDKLVYSSSESTSTIDSIISSVTGGGMETRSQGGGSMPQGGGGRP
ncbi:MAG: efflux RND transporter periplasmic adaptor subunit [Sphaerochaetaceae bacterium]|nr:efflux RND transporter periplasmic adaptor subunit [Sphaerochaetaceae bacterium]